MNSEHRKYWTAWFLEKAHVRVRLTSGARVWELSPPEVLEQWSLDDEVWSVLDEAVASKASECTIDVALGDEELDDISSERRKTIGALRDALYRRLARFLSDVDGWDEPPSEAPDARAWGHELAAQFTASLRALLSDPRGLELLRQRVLYVKRSDDVGTPMPEVLHAAGNEAIVEGIQEALSRADTAECDAFLERIPNHPLLLSDWAIERWNNGAAARSWLTFLGDLSLKNTVWVLLGRDAESLQLFTTSSPQRLELAKKHRVAIAGALEDAEFRNELDGCVIHEDPNDDEDVRWANARKESFASIAFRKFLDALERPELDEANLRDIDRRALLQAPIAKLVESAFWQSLEPNDIERWLKLRGFAILFYRPTDTAWEYLDGDQTLDFWLRVAASSNRSAAEKKQLFQTSVAIAQKHDCVQFDEMNELMTHFERDAQPELVASGGS